MLLFLRSRNTKGLGDPANNPFKIHSYYRMLGPASSSISLHLTRLQGQGSAVPLGRDKRSHLHTTGEISAGLGTGVFPHEK